MKIFNVFANIIIISTFVLLVGCSDGDSSRSSSRTNVDPEEVGRLMQYEKWGADLNSSDAEKKRKVVSEMMGAMQSGNIPQDAGNDYKELSRKYYGK